MKTHRREWKEKELENLISLLKQYNVLAIADLTQFPSSLLQKLRKKLKDKAVVKVSKKRVFQLAVEKSGKQFPDLNNYLKGNILLIFTNENPFELYSLVKKSKGKLFAKEGSIAPNDITVPEGDTGLPPGPVLTDLKNAGLNVRPQGATIHVVKDTVVAKKGEPIKAAVANVLKKLNIKALELFLPIKVAYEGSLKYTADVLDIDIDALFQKFSKAHSDSLALSIATSYPTKESIPLILQKAAKDSFVLALESNYLNKNTAPHILSKAQKIALHLKNLIK